jgi:transposase
MKKDKPEGYVFGRPTKYRPEYCQMLIDHMSEGYSFKSFAARVYCNEDTVAEWAKVHKDFSDAKTIGRALERFIWEKLHLRCAATGEGNMTGIVWAQKNKWPEEYKDKNETQVNQTLTHALTGDFKSLVATMTPEQMTTLISAIEGRTLELEASEDKKE